jgi:hypothetical protein
MMRRVYSKQKAMKEVDAGRGQEEEGDWARVFPSLTY